MRTLTSTQSSRSTRHTLAALPTMMLAGCAALGGPSPLRAGAGDVAGHYYQGDGLGTNIALELRADGTYDSTWYGCLGSYGASSGAWTIDAGEIRLQPAAETEMMVGYLRGMRVERSWPNYRLVTTAGSAADGEILERHFPRR